MPDIKKLTALLAAAVIAFSSAAAVFAEPDNTNVSGTAESQSAAAAPADASAGDTAEENAFADSSYTVNGDTIYMEDPGFTEPETSHAGAALLMDMNTGRLIYGKNVNQQMYPASLTKMMTGILALESGRMEETTVATYEALQSITLEDSHMGILIGEELTMTDLVNSMLIYSANDAANVIAVHLAGSIEAFVEMMNAKAQELGMTSTHFVNPCGVHDDNHYSTAQDLAILAEYCMQNEAFREIVKKPSYHIDPTNKYTQNRDLPSTNLFLSTARSASYLYKPCTGIKTGTTEAAGHCLVASAAYNDMNLLTVVLKCDDTDVKEGAYSYIVTRNLFDFGFSNYRSGVLATPGNIVADSKVKEAKNDKRVTLTVDTDVNALVPATNEDITSDVETVVNLNDTPIAPIAKGDVLGTVTYMYRGTELGRANLVAANDVEQNILLHYLYKIIRIITNPLVFIPVIVLIIIALIARSRKKRRERKRRIQQLKQRKSMESSQYDRSVNNTQHNRTSSKGANSRYSGDKRNW
ncbi:MAG: D-alanyl-D-alanine carboxypeptidase family protein [Candidatus Ornithomonoglobus sp.]